MSRYTFPLLIALLIVVGGCKKPAPGIAILSGQVTLDGKPLKAGIVSIASDDDVIRTSAELTPDGTYNIVGAPTGPVKLLVSVDGYAEILPEPGSPASAKSKPNPRYKPIPKKYESFETAGFTTTVPPGTSTYNIELVSR